MSFANEMEAWCAERCHLFDIATQGDDEHSLECLCGAFCSFKEIDRRSGTIRARTRAADDEAPATGDHKVRT